MSLSPRDSPRVSDRVEGVGRHDQRINILQRGAVGHCVFVAESQRRHAAKASRQSWSLVSRPPVLR